MKSAKEVEEMINDLDKMWKEMDSRDYGDEEYECLSRMYNFAIDQLTKVLAD